MTQRLIDRIKDFNNAVNALEQACKKDLITDYEDIIRDAIIQRYEFTFELAWKCLKDILEQEGIEFSIGSPKEALKNAFKYNLIDDGDIWLQMLDSRNQISHLYDEEKSKEIENNIRNIYLKEILKLRDKIIGIA